MRKRAESGGNAVEDEERMAVEDEADGWTERREDGIVGEIGGPRAYFTVDRSLSDLSTL